MAGNRTPSPLIWLPLVAAFALPSAPAGAGPDPADGRPHAAASGEIEARIEEVVEALHEGDYRAARARAQTLLEAAPDDPGVLFFAAYTHAWQGALQMRDLPSDPGFMRNLDRLIEISSVCSAGDGEAGRCALYGGMAALLQARAHYNSEERSLWQAAAGVRRGIRELERATALGARPHDAAFWIGAYEVMVSSLPLPLRAVRGLLGLPGGSRERGLEALERASSPPGRFRAEAALFLAASLAEGPPGGYSRALEVLQRSLPAIAERGSLLPLFAGELLANWGLTEQARTIWEGALARQRLRRDLYSPAEEARLRYSLARSLALELRWDGAEAVLNSLLEDSSGGSRSMRERATILLAHCVDRLGRRDAARKLLTALSESERARRALRRLENRPAADPAAAQEVSRALERWDGGDREGGWADLQAAARAHPLHEEALLHAGRAALGTGRGAEAATLFQQLAGKRAFPNASPEARGWALLHLGWLADASGRREEALDHYAHLRRLDQFEAWRAGALYSEVPYQEVRARASLLRAGGKAPAGAPTLSP